MLAQAPDQFTKVNKLRAAYVYARLGLAPEACGKPVEQRKRCLGAAVSGLV
jgi:hypothetical protein